MTVEESTAIQETASQAPVSPWPVLVPLVRVLVLPRSTFARLASSEVAVWPAAIALLVITAVVKGAMALGFAFRAPQGSRYLAAVGVRYVTDLVAPVAFALAAAGLFLLLQRTWQGDAPFGRLMSAVSLALVPLALRDLVQAGYMAFTRAVLLHPGLSALVAPPDRSMAGRLVYASLGQVDAFMLWALVLLMLAAGVTHGRGWLRAVLATLGIALLAVLLGALPSLAFTLLLFR